MSIFPRRHDRRQVFASERLTQGLCRGSALEPIALMRALELRPFLVSAWNDLGIALLRQGKSDRARQAWGFALALNPRFEAARRNLEATSP